MQEVPPIRQLIFLKHTLQLGVSGILLSLVIASLATPPRAHALSLSLDAGVRVPLLPQLDITSDVSLLETPIVQAQAGVTVRPPATKNQPAPAPIIGAGVSVPPVSSAPPLPAQPSSPVADTKSSVAQPAATSDTQSKNTSLSPAAITTQDVQKNAAPTQRRGFLGFDLPNGLGFTPQPFADKNNSFRVAVAALTVATVLFLALATFTTSKLTRGSPQKL